MHCQSRILRLVMIQSTMIEMGFYPHRQSKVDGRTLPDTNQNVSYTRELQDIIYG